MSPKTKAELAREHLGRALPAVTAEDYTEAVTWLFASLEAAVVGVADQNGLEAEKNHWNKAEVAKKLHGLGALPLDYWGLLGVLNSARKVAIYEGDEPSLQGYSLEDIATDVEAAVEAVEKGQGAS